MTRQHLEALAKALASTRPLSEGLQSVWKRDVLAVASVCKAFNPRFNLPEFIAACMRDYEAESEASNG